MNTIAALCPIDHLLQRELPAAKQGDQVAYGRIVKACQNTVTSVAMAITRDVASSEDIAQEAFINAWHHLERLQNADSFLPWLRQITRNLARDYLRAQHHRQLNGPNAELAMAVAADPGPQPVDRMIDDEYEATAFELISALPEDTREALVLFYREGQSTQQVAELLGISDAAARKRLSRARQEIRDDMLQRFGKYARSTAPSAAFVTAVTTALGSIASKPAIAATITAMGGSSMASKSLFGGLGLGFLGVTAAIFVNAIISLPLYLKALKILLQYADTLEERNAIKRFSKMLFIVSSILFMVMMLPVFYFPNFLLILLTIVLGLGVCTYLHLSVLAKLMGPLIERDAERDPVGAKLRKQSYDWTWGKSGIISFWVLSPLSALGFYLLGNIPNYIKTYQKIGFDGLVNKLVDMTTAILAWQ
jgi:RNA polymerase sigma factor (sigma-70 family)